MPIEAATSSNLPFVNGASFAAIYDDLFAMYSHQPSPVLTLSIQERQRDGSAVNWKAKALYLQIHGTRIRSADHPRLHRTHHLSILQREAQILLIRAPMFPLSPRIPDCFANIRRPIRIPIHKQLPTRVRDKEIRAGPIGSRRPDGTTPPCGPTSIAAPPGTRSRPAEATPLPSAPSQPAALVDR
nr:hypothetical protein Iba_chr08dCG7590 [Ipomoea batatas]